MFCSFSPVSVREAVERREQSTHLEKHTVSQCGAMTSEILYTLTRPTRDWTNGRVPTAAGIIKWGVVHLKGALMHRNSRQKPAG